MLYAGRLAGIALEHGPSLRIVVLLTGDRPVAPQAFRGTTMTVPIVFRTGAAATRRAMVLAMRVRQAALAKAYPGARGLGLDPRRGELVLLASSAMAAREPLQTIAERAAAILEVPVRVRLANQVTTDFALAGGARVVGSDPASGIRYACTTGFVVTDGQRAGLATAAHCPDALTYHDPAGGQAALPFVGQWGSRVYDVQINAAPEGVKAEPLFYADRRRGALRRVATWRNRISIRAGDFVCHYGESSGYSCAEVELTDYAPPGELCAGPCEPAWTTVKGPDCRSGDSGGPVFSGAVAIGITKGGSAGPAAGMCNFYYFMSVDYLPPGWRLMWGRGGR